MGQKEKHAITQAEYNKAAVHVLLRLAVTAPGCSTQPKVWCWHSSGSSSLVVAFAQTACEHVFAAPWGLVPVMLMPPSFVWLLCTWHVKHKQ